MFTSTGIVKYESTKAYLEIDPELVKYYRWFIPKVYNTRRQKFDAHISFVRKETIPKTWGLREGEEAKFEYDGVIMSDERYFWVGVWSEELENLRTSLGLPARKYALGDRFPAPFHFTIGNVK